MLIIAVHIKALKGMMLLNGAQYITPTTRKENRDGNDVPGRRGQSRAAL